MATELGSAFISVGMGTNTLAGDIKKAFSGAESSGSDAGKSAGKGFGGAFGIAAAALGALGIGTFFKSAISGAADLEQSMGAIGSVFKGSAGQMQEWSQQAAVDVGLSANEFNELGTLIGSQLKNGGTAMDELAPKTKSLISTGADLASMFGGTTSEAVEALSSALKGERDPIERYGVSLNQAKIDAEAASLGFKKVNGAFEQSAQQAATLSLITKQTADATGNFGRETDTLAHKQQVLNAQLANGKARIGTELLPVVAALTGALSSALGPAINGAVAGIQKMVGAGQGLYALFVKGDFTGKLADAFNLEEDSKAVDVMFRMRDAAIEVGGGFRAMFAAYQAGGDDVTSNGFAGVMERIGLGAREATGGVRAFFAAFAAGGDDITSSGFAGALEGLGLQARKVFDSIGVASAGVWSAIGPQVAALVPQVFALFQALSPTSLIFQALLPILPQIAAAIGSVVAAVLPLALSLTSQLLPIITQLVSAILPPLISILTDVVGAIAPIIGIIAGALIPIIIALLPVVVTVFGAVANVVKSVMQIVQGVIQVVTGLISGNWSRVWQGIQNVLGGVWNAIGAIISGAMATMRSVVIGGIGAVVGFFGGLGGKILGSLGNLGGLLMNAGRQILEGFLNGLRAGFESVKNFVGGIGDWIAANKGPKAYDLALLVPAGGWIMEGLGRGIEDSIPALQRTLGGVSATIAAGVVGANYSPAYTPVMAGVGAGGVAPVNVYIGNEQLDARMFRVADSNLASADSNSQYMRRGR